MCVIFGLGMIENSARRFTKVVSKGNLPLISPFLHVSSQEDNKLFISHYFELFLLFAFRLATFTHHPLTRNSQSVSKLTYGTYGKISIAIWLSLILFATLTVPRKSMSMTNANMPSNTDFRMKLCCNILNVL